MSSYEFTVYATRGSEVNPIGVMTYLFSRKGQMYLMLILSLNTFKNLSS